MSLCTAALPLIHFIPESLTYSVPLFLRRQCDRTLGKAPGQYQHEAHDSAWLGAHKIDWFKSDSCYTYDRGVPGDQEGETDRGFRGLA